MLGDDLLDMPPLVRVVYDRLTQARDQLAQLEGQSSTLGQLQRIQVDIHSHQHMQALSSMEP